MKKKTSIASYKIKFSSIIGVSILYFLLMESCFPFSGNSDVVSFFFYSKFFVSPLIIIYSFLPIKNHCINRHYGKVCNEIQKYLLIPWIIIFVFSIFSWIYYQPALNYITRGISNLAYAVFGIMVGCSLYKIYGQKILKYLIMSICLMYITNYIAGFYENGFIFIVKLFDFKCVESKILRYKELHEISYMSGILLIWLLLKKNRSISKIWIFIMTFGMIISFKRIGLFAFIVVLVYILIYRLLNKRNKVRYLKLSKLILFAVPFLYIILIASGNLSSLVEKVGLNVMGRDIIYSYFRKFTSVSPTFIGNGVGFVSRQFTYITIEDVGYVMFQLKQGLHNDFFRIYIEIGMLGTIVWLVYLCFIFPKIAKREFGSKCSLFLIVFMIYSFITYMTDNTLSYFMYQLTFSAIIVDLFIKEKKYMEAYYVQEIAMPKKGILVSY